MRNDIIKRCRTCALKQTHNGQIICSQFKIETNDDNYCSWHCKQLDYCDVCRSPLRPETGIVVEGKLYCGSCINHLGTCVDCSFGQECAFEADPDPMPKQVMRRIQQGNTIMQTAVKNPDRVDKFCTICKCYDVKTKECCKQQGSCCGNYKGI